MPIPFVGQRFNPAGFSQYLAQIQFGSSFNPTFVTLHHTWSPSLADRTSGFSSQHLQNLLYYYGTELGWSGAPHLFIDDQPNPIIVFQRLDRRGIHAKTFNSISWGVEMLGNYDSDSFSSGRGADVRDNAMQALELMCRRLGVEADTIRFHRDDPQANKSCPGFNVAKYDVVSRVAALLQQPLPDDMSANPAVQWTAVLPNGQPFVPVHTKDGRPIVGIRSFLTALGLQPDVALSQNKTIARWTVSAAKVVELPVVQIDEAGASWCLLRAVAEAAGLRVSVAGQVVTLS